jgi:hypothetical protein
MRHVLIIIFLSGLLQAKAQDFNCRVSVTDPSNESSYKQVFGALQTSLMEFFNNRKWTTENVQSNERIELNISVNIDQKLSLDQFVATFQILAVRPVYGTNYNTPLINFRDKEFSFRYAEMQSMDFNENQYNNLTSFLGFYANIVLGMAYDSFGPDGGSAYFNKAQTIVNTAQSAPESGWKQVMGTRSRNRYSIISDFTNSRYKGLHEGIYKYHRQGLDMMSKDVNAGRTAITEVITSIFAIAKQNPNSIGIIMFIDSKADELVEIYKKADRSEKNKIVDMLKQIDINNALKYDSILSEK